jgi:uncharacterized protein
MDALSTQTSASPWNDGELALQRSVGVVERMESVGRNQMQRNFMPDQHREFYAQLPFVVLGAVDKQGEAWATLRAGRPGFMHSPEPHHLHVALERDAQDPADAGMDDGAAVGMLGIELHTRRRNRMNGVVRRNETPGFDIEVTQAYGNCPRYIQLRQYEFVDTRPGPVTEMAALDERAVAMIGAADAFYIASYVVRDGEHQVDASHRGGKSGFVRIDADGWLTIPDFAGNLFFNTLGNILLNPRTGLTFIDMHSGDMLQMAGRAEVILDSPAIAAFQGAERLLRFKPQRIVYRPAALPLRWTDQADGASPSSLMTGDWADTEARLKAAAMADHWRAFQVERIVDESALIRSFYLAPHDGAGLPQFSAGQHLPVRLMLPGEPLPQIRTYTLSAAPLDGFLRISVKREGRFSRHLHDAVKPGDIIEARAPAGCFTIDAAERRPAVLLGAGVGITPLLAMARHLVKEGARTRHMRRFWLFQSAYSKAQRAFDSELAALARSAQQTSLNGPAQQRMHHVRVLGETAGAEAGQDYDEQGRLGIELLKKTLPFDDYDFYLCGPSAFMQQMYDGLRGMNVSNSRIHAEAFGPAGLNRRPDAGEPQLPAAAPATEPVPVFFMNSAKEARWTPGDTTLLELAEQRGLAPEFSCRGGSCGTCHTPILSGAVAYLQTPSFEVADGEALICCAVPAEGTDSLRLAL